MNNFVFDTVNSELKVNQIVCLEHDNSSLYGEVIQLIPHRNLCWFRPICLVIIDHAEEDMSFASGCLISSKRSNSSKSTHCPKVAADLNFEAWQIEQQYSDSAVSRIDNLDSTEYQLIDLQSTSDLFWPTVLFRPALDTEAFSFVAQLNDIRHHSIDITPNYRYLNKFVQQFWQTNQDKFLRELSAV